MSELTADEESVLSIASTGESMIPIGRWKEPTLELTRRGLMRANDPSNYFITDAGRKALAQNEDEPFRQILESGNKIANERAQIQQSIEQAALHLSFAAKASSLMTGETPEVALSKWIVPAQDRAKELLKNG